MIKGAIIVGLLSAYGLLRIHYGYCTNLYLLSTVSLSQVGEDLHWVPSFREPNTMIGKHIQESAFKGISENKRGGKSLLPFATLIAAKEIIFIIVHAC